MDDDSDVDWLTGSRAHEVFGSLPRSLLEERGRRVDVRWYDGTDDDTDDDWNMVLHCGGGGGRELGGCKKV